MAAGFFYSKTFKIIATVILSVELIIIITLKVVDLYCDEPGCWNKKDWGTNYCMEHINSIYEEAMKRERAYVEGGKVKISSPKDAIQAGIGLVPEDRKGLGLILGMSIKDNMLISKIGQFKSSLLNKKTLKNITGTFISDLGISLRNEEQEVKELSGGNQQKVVIAKWLAMEPNILIMDEPTRGIDIGAKSEIYALMRKMTEQGMSIIMISSEMAEVMQVSDRILVMHEGSISGELTAEEVTRNNIMQAAFGGVRE